MLCHKVHTTSSKIKVTLLKMHGQTNKGIRKNNELPCAIIKHFIFGKKWLLTYNQNWIKDFILFFVDTKP
jgi:hypothetical protein